MKMPYHLTELETPRLILRGINPSFIHNMYRRHTKQEVIDFFGFDEKGYEHFNTMHLKGMETHRLSLFFLSLFDKQQQKAIGECGFNTWNAFHQRSDLFYSICFDENKRKGFMTEALGPVLQYGFTEMKLDRVAAYIDKMNTPSLKLLQRYGFTFEGTMRQDYLVEGVPEDSECYSLLKPEWEKQLSK